MSKGSRLQRVVDYFREASPDEARVTFQLVKEVMDERLKERVAKVPIKRRKRRTRAEVEAAAKLAEVPSGGTSSEAAD